jgi:hypothetical protein
MQLDLASRPMRLALTVWVIVLLAVSCRAALSPRTHTVYPIFSRAGADWLSARDLFAEPPRPGIDVYRYSPFAALAFAPLGLLPDAIGGVLWRLFGAALFLGGFAWWTRRALPGRLSANQQAALWLLLVPLSLPSLNNGQSNVHVIGLLLIAIAASAERRWNLASACLAVACWFKVYPIAIGLLLVVVYPRHMSWRLLAALAATGAMPFLFQQGEYVTEMHEHWFAHLGSDARRWNPIALTYRDLWLLCRLWCPIRVEAYVAVQMMTALGVAAICLRARARAERLAHPFSPSHPSHERRLLTVLTLLGTGWMMLCGPATETCTYVMIAPALAWTAVEAWRWPRSVFTRTAVAGSLLLFAARPALAQLPGWRDLSFATQPLATLLLMLVVLTTQVPELFQSMDKLPAAPEDGQECPPYRIAPIHGTR